MYPGVSGVRVILKCSDPAYENGIYKLSAFPHILTSVRPYYGLKRDRFPDNSFVFTRLNVNGLGDFLTTLANPQVFGRPVLTIKKKNFFF